MTQVPHEGLCNVLTLLLHKKPRAQEEGSPKNMAMQRISSPQPCAEILFILDIYIPTEGFSRSQTERVAQKITIPPLLISLDFRIPFSGIFLVSPVNSHLVCISSKVF